MSVGLIEMGSIEIVATSNKRADTLLRDAFSGPGKRLIKRLFDQQLVHSNGQTLKKGDVVNKGTIVTIQTFSELSEVFTPVPEALPLTKVHETNSFLILDKPASIPSMPLSPGEKGTLANRLVHFYPTLKGIGMDPREAGLVNRLDAGTSGLLLVAKNQDSWRSLRSLFKNHLVKKQYIAICESRPIAKTNESPLSQAKGKSFQHPSGQRASTTIVDCVPHGRYWKTTCSTTTGRMHQIRVHLADLSAPLVGDVLYGGKANDFISRHALHASRITFPLETDQFTATSKMPLDMSELRNA